MIQRIPAKIAIEYSNPRWTQPLPTFGGKLSRIMFIIFWRGHFFVLILCIYIFLYYYFILFFIHRWSIACILSSHTGRILHLLSERLASLGIMEVQLRASLKHLDTIVRWYSRGFREALNWTSIMTKNTRLIAVVFLSGYEIKYYRSKPELMIQSFMIRLN